MISMGNLEEKNMEHMVLIYYFCLKDFSRGPLQQSKNNYYVYVGAAIAASKKNKQ